MTALDQIFLVALGYEVSNDQHSTYHKGSHIGDSGSLSGCWQIADRHSRSSNAIMEYMKDKVSTVNVIMTPIVNIPLRVLIHEFTIGISGKVMYYSRNEHYGDALYAVAFDWWRSEKSGY